MLYLVESHRYSKSTSTKRENYCIIKCNTACSHVLSCTLRQVVQPFFLFVSPHISKRHYSK